MAGIVKLSGYPYQVTIRRKGFSAQSKPRVRA